MPAELRGAAKLAAAGENPSTIRVSSSITPIMFDPDQALGSSMDILSHDVIEKIYTEPMVKQCLSAGWGPITYRQNTELIDWRMALESSRNAGATPPINADTSLAAAI